MKDFYKKPVFWIAVVIVVYLIASYNKKMWPFSGNSNERIIGDCPEGDCNKVVENIVARTSSGIPIEKVPCH